MGGLACKDEALEEKRSVGTEDSLTSAERIRRITSTQSGSTVLSLARRGLQVGAPPVLNEGPWTLFLGEDSNVER